MRVIVRVVAVVTCLMLAPSLALAQASIAGVVRDASGAVLPGVTVEASSPVLIEKVRSVATDGSGQYRIVDLRPGTYSVTFTLPGFSTVKREGIELTGTFIAQINVELRVGGLQETITVTGETPIVDVQSVRRQTTLTSETITSIPTARSWAATAMLIPGIVTQAGSAADVQITPQMTVFGGMGGRANEGRMEVDGLGTGAALNGGGVSTYVADISNAAEVTTTTSGGLGEAEVGGPTLSIVPKSGGNTLSGSVYLTGTGAGLIRSNYDDTLKARGLSTPGTLTKQWDFTGGVGGPIVRDRVWFYGTARSEGQYRSIPGIYPNLNAGDPTKFLYVPDTSRVAQGAEGFKTFSARFTIQGTPKNRFNVFWEEQMPCNGAAYSSSANGACRDQHLDNVFIGAIGLGGLTGTTSPETSGYLPHTLVRNRQLTWSSTATNKLLLEAGLGVYQARWGPFEMPGNPTRGLVRVTELTGVGNGNIPGLTYRSANWANDYDSPTRWRAAMSYVTGAHNFKVGTVGAYMIEDITNFTNDLNLSYTFLGGRPSSLTEFLNPYTQKNRVSWTAYYAQDQWTRGRVTLQGALRFDRASSWSPAQTIGPTNYLTSQISFPRTDGVSYKDLSPRGGAAWDVFGNGRTAVKVNVGKYLDPASNLNDNYSISNPIQRIATSATRTWSDANGDYVPQCDLAVSTANGECGAMNLPTFGTGTYITGNIDPALLNGWSVRPGDWQIGASVQQQLMKRVSVELGYFRRWLTNFTATDNRLVTAADYTPFSLTAPSDTRLPNGGGYTVSGLYNVVPAKFGPTDNNITFAKNFGEWTQVYNGVLFNVVARAGKGLTFQGGVNSGKTVQDLCGVRSTLPELSVGIGGSTVSPTNPYCRIDPGFITKVTGLASYTVPKVDVLVSGTWRSDQGAPLRAIWNAPVATVSSALGRPAAVAGTTVPIDLIAPGQAWGDRVNEIDTRFAKILRFGRTRSTIGLDIYNVLNSNAVLTFNQTFNPAVLTGPGSWQQPLSVLTPRFFKISAQVDF